jgi:hypothetical protein
MSNARIGEQKRKQAIELWLRGTTRAEIQRIIGISSGALSNIIADYNKRLDGYDPEAVKDLSKTLSEENITPSQSAIGSRIVKMIIEMGGDEEKNEAFLSSLKNECIEKEAPPPPSAIVPSLQAAIEFSEKEGISISEVPGHLEKRKTELTNLEAEIEAVKAEKNKVLNDAKLTIEDVNEFSQFRSKLAEVGLTTKDVEKSANAIRNTKALGCDPVKISAQFSRTKSFRSEEREHRLRRAEWEEERKHRDNTDRLAEWFVSNGYTIGFFELVNDILTDIAVRDRITIQQAEARFITAIISYRARDGLISEVASMNQGLFILDQERQKLQKYVDRYRTLGNVVDALIWEVGPAEAEAIMGTFCEIAMSPYYRSNPQGLMHDLNEVRKKRREEQLHRLKQNHDVYSKLKHGNAASASPSSAPAPSPVSIENDDEVSGSPPSDQSRKEEDAAAPTADGGDKNQIATNTHEQQRQDNQENGAGNSC